MKGSAAAAAGSIGAGIPRSAPAKWDESKSKVKQGTRHDSDASERNTHSIKYLKPLKIALNCISMIVPHYFTHSNKNRN